MLAAAPQHLFAPDGELHHVSGNTPFLLTDAAAVWWVEAGGVDVFSVRVVDGQPAGSRRAFCSVGVGRALFGFGPPVAGRALLAVGLPETRLRKLPFERVRALARDPSFAPAVTHLVDGWIEAVSAGVARDVQARIDVLLEPEVAQPIAANARFQARREVVWLPPSSGDMLFIGMEEIPGAGARFPVAHHAWAQALAPLSLTGEATAAVIADEQTWIGFARFLALVAHCEAMNRRLSEVDDLNRQRDRAAAGERATQRALADLASVLNATAPVAEATVEDPLFLACTAVGRTQEIVFQPPAEMLKGEPLEDPLGAITRATRVRSRKVALNGDWWTQDGGAMLGFLADKRQPVALLPAGSGRYVLHNPQDGSESPITADVAATLESFAHVFYRSFGSGIIRGRELLRFGARGLQPEIWRLLAFGLGGGVLSTLPAIATAAVFDSLVPSGARGALVQLTLGLFGVGLAAAVFGLTRGLALLRIEGRMDQTLQAAVIDRLIRLPMPFFRGYSAGDLAQRTHGITEMRRLLSSALVTAGLGNLFAWVNLAVLAAIDLRLAGVACGLLVIAVAFTAATSVRQLTVQRRVAAQQGFIGGLVLQFITGIAKLRVAGAEDLAFSAWARPFARQKRDAMEARRLDNRVVVFNALFPLLASAVLFWIVAPARGETTLSVGAFLAFTTAFTALLAGMLAITAGLASVLQLVPLLERVQPLLQTAPEDHGGKLEPGTLTGRIELSHVSFRYAPKLPLVLDDVSLEIQPGEFVAIVGASGSGKSTLLRLLLGFETPESGALHYDRQDLKQLDLAAVRRQIGVVLQTSQPTAGTIWSNIAGARPLTHDDAWNALRLAGLEEDVREMPMGLHTVLPSNGGVLSGGQRQRLMIARAIVSRPRILFFDEATSALDNRTQAIVSASLEELVATRVVIAHRLSTVMRADRIVVMSAGRIVQSGSYEELIRVPGLFADLAARQRLTSNEAAGARFLF